MDKSQKFYNYKNCQSLFGYAAKVHIKFKGKCQLCGCSGESPSDFDIWRQMTVEHIIGKSQGGYLVQIRDFVKEKFSELPEKDQLDLSKKIEFLNTVTACHFCNSTTSRHISSKNMKQIIDEAQGSKSNVLKQIEEELKLILEEKIILVKWKIKSVEKAFKEEILPNMI